MAREFPIHNGRMTTDLDANGHRIKNLPPGSGFTQVQSDWGQMDTTAPDFIKNKPEIPAPVTIDPALSPTSENPVQNKVVTEALYTGFTEWQLTTNNLPQAYSFVGASFVGDRWIADIAYDDGVGPVVVSGVDVGGTQDSTSITFTYVNTTNTMSRHLITPTKTSQLTNDGGFLTQHQDISGKLDGAAAYPAWEHDKLYQAGEVVSYKGRIWKCIAPAQNIPPDDEMDRFIWGDSPVTIDDLKQDALSPAQLAAVNSGVTAAKVETWDGYAAQKASMTDLPYALVEPGVWAFSDGQSYVIGSPEEDQDGWVYAVQDLGYSQYFTSEADALAALSLTFDGAAPVVTATRASLPGHLLDRAGNHVVVSGDTTLTLPALEHAGKLRDFLVRLEISGSTVPTITFQGQGSEAPDGADEIIYETDGDEFPVPDEAGTWLYSFTEGCVAHKFVVSLKKVNVVVQGGP